LDKSVITRVVRVAGGRFAPGHLGELTQQVPFEMVDAVLEQTCRVQRRVRDLPSRVVVYLLAGCLFAELGYCQVWRRLTAGLDGLPVRAPTASAMTQARRRLGPGPLRELFFLLRGPDPAGAVAGAAGLRDRRHHHVRGRQRGEPGRLLQAARRPERGFRLPDAAAADPGQLRHPQHHRRRVPPRLQRRDHLRPAAAGQPARRDAAAGRPELLRRLPGRTDHGGQGRLPDPRPHRERRPQAPVLRRLPDGSWLSRFGGAPVRVIDAQVTVTTGAGRTADGCRLITTLTDAARYPAGDLAVLYHERWEIETAYPELKSTILGGRVLRARTPDGIEQEIYALLVTYQALRTAIADAAATVPGTDPDWASFAVALNAAREQVILAAGITAGAVTDLAGKIGSPVLASLMPARRLRISPRVVKRAMSRYNAKGKVDRTTCKATIDIAILAAPLTPGGEP
jgi:hypothetical protein